MRSATFIVLVVLCSHANAQEFVFVQCEDTGQHFSVQPDKDYYLVHWHLRVKDWRGNRFFGRVRLQYPEGAGEDSKAMVSTTSTAVAAGDNDVWSLYFRIPRIKDERQADAVYQIEVGTFDPLGLNEYTVMRSFSWKMLGGDELRMSTDENTYIPLLVRTATVEGGGIKIRYGDPAPLPPLEVRYSVVDTLPVGDIPGERSMKRLR